MPCCAVCVWFVVMFVLLFVRVCVCRLIACLCVMDNVKLYGLSFACACFVRVLSRACAECVCELLYGVVCVAVGFVCLCVSFNCVCVWCLRFTAMSGDVLLCGCLRVFGCAVLV